MSSGDFLSRFERVIHSFLGSVEIEYSENLYDFYGIDLFDGLEIMDALDEEFQISIDTDAFHNLDTLGEIKTLVGSYVE